MKKFIAILLTLLLLIGTGTAAMAKPPQASQSTTVLPANSTYEFKYQLPAYVVEDKDAVLGVTLKTKVLGQSGYDDAYIKFTASGPGVVDLFKDSSNHYASGSTIQTLDLPAQYNVTTNWYVNFSKDGEYTITFTAYDSDDNQIATPKSQKIIVTDGAFVITVQENILPETEAAVNVRFITEQTYNSVRFAAAAASQNGDVTFKARNADNDWYYKTDSATWGPYINITSSYDQTNSWKLTFAKTGNYTIIFKLVDDEGNTVIQSSQKIVVKGSATDVEEDDEDNDGKGNAHGLLNALRAHVKNKNKGENHGRIQSMNRLMEILQSRGISLAELEKAIKEMEEALAGDDDDEDDDEDFKALGKMHQAKGKKFGTFVNGKKVEYDTEPILENGRTLVPFRKIAEALGAEVSYDSEKKQVTVSKDGITVVINIGKNTATVNGTAMTLDAPAKIYKDRTLVPLRFLAEAFDATVDFYSEGSLISIKKKNGR